MKKPNWPMPHGKLQNFFGKEGLSKSFMKNIKLLGNMETFKCSPAKPDRKPTRGEQLIDLIIREA